MKLNQLSVFLENKPGRLSHPCKALADAGVNILTLSMADTQQFGILRLIVSDWEQAKSALDQAGCVVKITEVVAVQVSDKPGGLEQMLQVIESEGVNIEYIYAFTLRRGDKAVLVFRFDDPDRAITLLQEKGFSVIESVDLYEGRSP